MFLNLESLGVKNVKILSFCTKDKLTCCWNPIMTSIYFGYTNWSVHQDWWVCSLSKCALYEIILFLCFRKIKHIQCLIAQLHRLVLFKFFPVFNHAQNYVFWAFSETLPYLEFLGVHFQFWKDKFVFWLMILINVDEPIDRKCKARHLFFNPNKYLRNT